MSVQTKARPPTRPRLSAEGRTTRPMPESSQQRHSDELIPFAAWLRKVTPNQLTQWLQHMLWHGQLEDTELYRAFILEYYKGITMRHDI